MIKNVDVIDFAKVGIIGDVHLNPERPELTHLFQSFLQGRAQQFDTLFIIGDLFDYWIGDDAMPLFQTEVEALARYAQNHTVYVQHGNRDFLLGAAFAEQTHTHLIDDPCMLCFKADGKDKRIGLIHGDSACTLDVQYQDVRQQMRNPEWQQMVMQMTIEQRLAQAKAFRMDSQTITQDKATDLQKPTEEALVALLNTHNMDELIHGHTHQPQQYRYNDKLISVVGDWSNNHTEIAVFSQEGSIVLEHFHI